MEVGQFTKDIKRRVGLAAAMFKRLSSRWKTSSISTRKKVKLYRTFVIPGLMYGSELWC